MFFIVIIVTLLWRFRDGKTNPLFQKRGSRIFKGKLCPNQQLD